MVKQKMPHPALISGTHNGLTLEGAHSIYDETKSDFLQKITFSKLCYKDV
ncbi:hypothetical protein [Pantoea ananatis]|nr:hypothetical protein [Pantoea ananatis]MCH9271081.1 hypothetical protein [Pantoea ananatis]